MKTNLDRIKELTSFLNEFVVVDGETHRGSVSYDVKYGEAYGKSYLNIPEISVAKIFLSKGGLFPMHKHETVEFLYVMAGRILCYVGADESVLEVGDYKCIDAGEAHSMRAYIDSIIWAITIPPAKGFPSDFTTTC